MHVGFDIEWRSSFREYQGIVVNESVNVKDGKSLEVWETFDQEHYQVTSSQYYTIKRPNLEAYAKYVHKKYSSITADILAVRAEYSKVLGDLSSLSNPKLAMDKHSILLKEKQALAKLEKVWSKAEAASLAASKKPEKQSTALLTVDTSSSTTSIATTSSRTTVIAAVATAGRGQQVVEEYIPSDEEEMKTYYSPNIVQQLAKGDQAAGSKKQQLLLLHGSKYSERQTKQRNHFLSDDDESEEEEDEAADDDEADDQDAEEEEEDDEEDKEEDSTDEDDSEEDEDEGSDDEEEEEDEDEEETDEEELADRKVTIKVYLRYHGNNNRIHHQDEEQQEAQEEQEVRMMRIYLSEEGWQDLTGRLQPASSSATAASKAADKAAATHHSHVESSSLRLSYHDEEGDAIRVASLADLLFYYRQRKREHELQRQLARRWARQQLKQQRLTNKEQEGKGKEADDKQNKGSSNSNSNKLILRLYADHIIQSQQHQKQHQQQQSSSRRPSSSSSAAAISRQDDKKATMSSANIPTVRFGQTTTATYSEDDHEGEDEDDQQLRKVAHSSSGSYLPALMNTASSSSSPPSRRPTSTSSSGQYGQHLPEITTPKTPPVNRPYTGGIAKQAGFDHNDTRPYTAGMHNDDPRYNHHLPAITVPTTDHHNHHALKDDQLVEAADDHYELVWQRGDLLGVGSFGKVYAAINLLTGQKLAVKEVAIQPEDDSKQRRRWKEQVKSLQQEVNVLRQLRHENIIHYYGMEYTQHTAAGHGQAASYAQGQGQAGITLRIFLELATEGSLRDLLKEFGQPGNGSKGSGSNGNGGQQGGFPEPLLRRYTMDIVQGLHYLHSQRIIHRDIKPANLLLSSQGVVKLADFGCAALSTAAATATTSASAGGSTGQATNEGWESNHSTVAGTTVYMAPEIMVAMSGGLATGPGQGQGNKGQKKISSSNKYGRKADIWSLGMTLIELATGQPPYKTAAAAIYTCFVSQNYPTFPATFSAEAHAFLARCLTVDSSQRAMTTELLQDDFLLWFYRPQTVEDRRVQTAASLMHTPHTQSTVRLSLPMTSTSDDDDPNKDEDGEAEYEDEEEDEGEEQVELRDHRKVATAAGSQQLQDSHGFWRVDATIPAMKGATGSDHLSNNSYSNFSRMINNDYDHNLGVSRSSLFYSARPPPPHK